MYRKCDQVNTPLGEGVVIAVADDLVEVFRYKSAEDRFDEIFEASELELVAAAPVDSASEQILTVGELRANRIGWKVDREARVHRVTYLVYDHRNSPRGRLLGAVREVADGFQATPHGRKTALPVSSELVSAVVALRPRRVAS